MDMALASQMVAGDCVEHATTEEGGTNQDVDDVEHDGFPWSATRPLHAAGMLRCTQTKRRDI
jgi:hypothetical protein